MVISQMRLFKNYLSIEDLTYLASLLENDISLNFCFELLKNKKNQLILNDINNKLNKGLLIEDVIYNYLPSQIKSYFKSLIKNISFKNSLRLSLDFYYRNKDEQNKIISTVAYPLFILLASITALYFFEIYGLDTIFNLLKSFEINFEFYISLRVVFKIVIRLFYYLIIIICLLILFFINKKRIVYLYLFSAKYFNNSLFNTYHCYDFVSLLLIILNKGYQFKEAIEILKKMKSLPIVSFLAFHLDESLLNGASLKEATKSNYYDSSLSRFIKIANYSNDFIEVINNYLLLTEQKLKKKIKTYSLSIQITSYVFIAFIIIFIYQILFMPMSAIGGF